MSWPAVPWTSVPAVSSRDLRDADAAALDRFGIQPLQLMEVAGWQVARFLAGFIGPMAGKRVLVVAGSGNNGGDALCVARFLHLKRARVSVSLVGAKDQAGLAAQHRRTVEALGIPIANAPDGIHGPVDVIADGLFGTGIRPPLRPPALAIIQAINDCAATVVSIDVPSGMDADDGTGEAQAVQAAATVTLAAPKPGLKGSEAAGRVFLADIGMPPQLFGTASESLQAVFATGDLVELIR